MIMSGFPHLLILPLLSFEECSIECEHTLAIYPSRPEKSWSSSLKESEGRTGVVIFRGCQSKRQIFIVKDTVSPLLELRPTLESR